jgi:pSer/pThr/pTyr-binding forkhead associated (FHA) protein
VQASDGSHVKPNPVDNRKIVGVLASYSWRAEGQLFAVREGRTHIGAGNIKEDIAHREVDVRCPDDELMSEDHAMILVQQKKYWIRDLDSTNGTVLNGEHLPPDATVELPNNSEIKVGKTDFTFLKIEPKSSPVTEKRPEPVKEKEPEPAPRHSTILR